jgi:ABC-type transport system involved in multi-copper enzyme maturation permease subunit
MAVATFETRPVASAIDVSGLLASETTKLRSVRSTYWTLAVAAVCMVGLGALFCLAEVNRWDRLSPGDQASFDPTAHSLRGFLLAQMAIGVLGVLAITNEYTTGMIRNTFTATPQRRAVLAAKGFVFTAVALVVGMVGSFTTFFVGQAILDSKGIGASLSDPTVLRAVVGGGLYLAVIGLFGLALGAVLRHTPAAITALFGLLLVLPILSNALPSPWNQRVAEFTPGEAGRAILNVRPQSNLLAPWTGMAVLVGYVAITLVIASVLIDRRDT